jgi:ethanolamine ammonia-lyase large subunit
MKLEITMFQRTYQFKSIKEILAKANEEKSGDKLAGIHADNVKERIAAKEVLSMLTIAELRNAPIIAYEVDEVTRMIQDNVNEAQYAKIKNMTIGEFREFLLARSGEEIASIRDGLTAEVIAGVAKLMSNMDLVYVAKKLICTARCNTTIGLPGVLASRLQPNHPTDSLEGIRASMMDGLSYGVGDALIGLNPAGDTSDKVKKILNMFKDFTEQYDIPTQNCVLAHITTQIEALKNHAPMDVMFQSLAGTQKGNQAFGINKKLLDKGYQMMKEEKSSTGPNFMYFETGQGAELSSNSHHGADQVTLEARCYGLAKQYHPFLVNTVVGFIGPEYLYDGNQVIRAGLEDHFMGKLTGVPMGVDVCYTNHMKADQNTQDTLAMLLAQAGCSYFMGIPAGDDVMLMYQSTSFHDIATLRQLTNTKPIAEFEQRMEQLGILNQGKLGNKAGDISIFTENTSPADAKKSYNAEKTNARVGIGHCGGRLNTKEYLKLRQDHGIAQDAVWGEALTLMLDDFGFFNVQTMAEEKETYIKRPDLGRTFSPETLEQIKRNCKHDIDVQILAGDGLSAAAIPNNINQIVPVLMDGFKLKGYTIGTPIYIKHARVGTMDKISELLQAKVTIIFIGERPGLASDDSMSAYIAYDASAKTTDAQRTVVSNIHNTGLNPLVAGAQIVDLVEKMLKAKKSGVDLVGC